MIVLDTHALVWWVSESERIPPGARAHIESDVAAGKQVSVSSISVWEIAMLVANGRLAFTIKPDAWIAQVEALPFVSFVPVDNRIAMRAVALPEFAHKDPADRIIVATAIGLDATLVTADRQLRSYAGVETLWD